MKWLTVYMFIGFTFGCGCAELPDPVNNPSSVKPSTDVVQVVKDLKQEVADLKTAVKAPISESRDMLDKLADVIGKLIVIGTSLVAVLKAINLHHDRVDDRTAAITGATPSKEEISEAIAKAPPEKLAAALKMLACVAVLGMLCGCGRPHYVADVAEVKGPPSTGECVAEKHECRMIDGKQVCK